MFHNLITFEVCNRKYVWTLYLIITTIVISIVVQVYFYSKLRKKLKNDTNVQIINVRGFGYKLIF